MNIEEKALYLLNSERQARGLVAFRGINSKVTNVAQTYAQDLLDNNYFEHERQSDGASP
jgi:uncharacterized protein YkwD